MEDGDVYQTILPGYSSSPYKKVVQFQEVKISPLQVMENYTLTCRFDLKRKYPVTMKYLLTDREQLVMNLVCQGKSNHEIAIELEVSINTIKTHLQHVYKKLEVDNRTQASVRYLNIRSRH